MANVPLRVYDREIETMIDRALLDEAVAHCRHILKTFPKHLETYRLLGKAHLEYKHYSDAADIFSRVLVSVPSDFVANVGMSIIRDEENKLDDAIWHMERAFETQPSNAAIQSELQRLYGRRDGVQPPRIRMTRGALAQMYVQGELYPQAISEIKNILDEDPGRNDMQELLARAYYRSGLKNDAADVASALLRSNPYNLDANRVLVEILGTEHPESVQAYRQRVVELDPYAAQVSGSIFLADAVPDNAVTLERLDWTGEPAGMPSDWEPRLAIAPESGGQQQPDWLKSSFSETPSSVAGAAPVPPFEAPAASTQPSGPADDIPEFLRAAGWGSSTGAFDESKSAFAEGEPASAEPPIEQGELPDWVKALAPQQPEETPIEEEPLPDWINQIGTTALPASPEAAESLDWMNPPGQAADQQPGAKEQPPVPAGEEPDWLKGFGNEPEPETSAPSTGEFDWLSQLAGGSQSKTESVPAADSTEDFDFLNPLGSQFETKREVAGTEEFDLLNEPLDESRPEAPISMPAGAVEPMASTPAGMSEEEQDDSFAWLESLAAKQGATEGLLTSPEQRSEQEPDWVKAAKGLDVPQPPAQEVEQPAVQEPARGVEELGKTEQELDDSFAWLESLAAKQGATEGLLTKPEERLDEEPEWVRQAKSLSASPGETAGAQGLEEQQSAAAEPSAALEAGAASGAELDDSFAWLRGPSQPDVAEGPLTEPAERPQEELDWMKAAGEVDEAPGGIPGAEMPASALDTAAWLKSLDEEAAAEPAPAAAKDDTAVWFMKLEASETSASQPAEDLPAWMRNIDQEKEAGEELTLPSEEMVSDTAKAETSGIPEVPEWMGVAEQESVSGPAASIAEPALESPEEEIPSWLSELDKEPERAVTSGLADDDLPAWLRDDSGELLAEPTKIEPMRASDWRPVEMEASQPEPEVAVPGPVAAEPEPVELVALPEPEVAVLEPVAEAPEVETAAAELEPVEAAAMAEERPVTPEPEPQPEFAASEPEPAALALEPESAAAELAVPPAEPEPVEAVVMAEEKPVAAEPEPQPEFAAFEPEPAALALEPESAAAELAVPPAEPEPVEAVMMAEERPVTPEPEPQPEFPVSEPEPLEAVAMAEEKPVAAEPEPEQPTPPSPREPARKVTGPLGDPILAQARGELSRSNISGAVDGYAKLIKKGRFLEDIVYDLREALYRHPVEVNIWQTLGDAYMRANRLQDALDAYTKAEELLR